MKKEGQSMKKKFPLTEDVYGFRWGPMEVMRVSSGEKLGVVLQISTRREVITVRSTPTGYLRVH